MSPGRYHLTLTSDSRTMMHGWWHSEQTARRKFTTWIGERGSMPNVRITLIDKETHTVLTTWPEEQ